MSATLLAVVVAAIVLTGGWIVLKEMDNVDGP